MGKLCPMISFFYKCTEFRLSAYTTCGDSYHEFPLSAAVFIYQPVTVKRVGGNSRVVRTVDSHQDLHMGTLKNYWLLSSAIDCTLYPKSRCLVIQLYVSLSIS